MNLLFWNIMGNNLSSYIATCLINNDIDIAIFSEHKGTDFKTLSKKIGYSLYEGMGGCDKTILLSKKNVQVDLKQEQNRYALYVVNIDRTQYVLAGIHLHDRRNTDTATRIAYIGRLVNDIKNIERNNKCSNTIIIGDFNANPYDDELLQANAFNAVLFKEVIRKSETRTIDETVYRRFYNPILNFISEDTKNYGSFYFTQGSNSPIWHCLDQILISKPLIDRFDSMCYLKQIGNNSLIKKIQPNEAISDHLPLFAKIN